jgi:hypothetical protein
MLLMSLACDAIALGSNQVEVENASLQFFNLLFEVWKKNRKVTN